MQSDIKSQIRTLVSKKKKRYQANGFNLDLSYVTNRIIAMGFPAEKFEAIYRNNIDEVSKFFECYHSGNYKIYNLCRERDFDTSKFTGETVRFPFDDHNPPAFTVLHDCIENIAIFLNENPHHVVGIHCKAGKGRTGVVVCCTMIHCDEAKDATEALNLYGINRTTNGKGVTIPSQIRYVFYYDHYIKKNLKYCETQLWLRSITFENVPNIGNEEMEFAIYQSDACVRTHLSKTYKVPRQSRIFIFNETICSPLKGDVKFQFIHKSIISGKKILCECWLNTFFVINKPLIQFYETDTKLCDKTILQRYFKSKHKTTDDIEDDLSNSKEVIHKVTLMKNEIDKANKDLYCKVFPDSFCITFLFANGPSNYSMFNSTSEINLGNSKFFDDRESINLTSQLEELWELKSPQFYNSLA